MQKRTQPETNRTEALEHPGVEPLVIEFAAVVLAVAFGLCRAILA